MSVKPVSSSVYARIQRAVDDDSVSAAQASVRGVARAVVDGFSTGTARSAATAGPLSRSVVEGMVGDAYRNLLRREPDEGGLKQWTDAAHAMSVLGSRGDDLAAYLKQQLEGSPEFLALTLVDRTFQEELGRGIDGTRGYWHEAAVVRARDEGMPPGELEGWLRASFQSSPEYRHASVGALVEGSFQKMLSRSGGEAGYWHDEAHRMVDEGRSPEEITEHLNVSLGQSDEYRRNAAGQLVDGAFWSVLDRSGGEAGYWHDEAFGMLKAGSSEEEVRAHLEASLRGSDEYVLAHLGDVVASKYRDHLGREPDEGGLAGWTSFAESLKAEGKSGAEIHATLDEQFRASDEYRALHTPPASARPTREEIYLQQPNGWTCAPTSLTMALAHFGVRAGNYDTMWDMVAQTGASADVGLPGNASLLANAARNNGLQAEFSPSRNVADVRAQLEAGRGVIVNGNLTTGGHFLYISGLDEQGRYVVADPYRPSITRWTDADLHHFTHNGSNPPGFAALWR